MRCLFITLIMYMFTTEAVVWLCSAKKEFLKFSQNSQENTGGSLLLIKLHMS